MKARPVGPSLDGWHRYYFGEEGPSLSVTTATSVIDKPALDQWRVNQTALVALKNSHALDALPLDEALRAVKAATEGIRVDSAEFGTACHALFHEHATGTEHPVVQIGSDEERFLQSFALFMDDYDLDPPWASELAVFNDTNMTAGRVDQIWRASKRLAVELDVEVGDLVMVDDKTGKAWYPETELQLAGYSAMEYFGYPGDPVKHPMPPIAAHAVLHVRPHEYEGGHPDGYKLIPYSVTQESIDLFRACVSLKRWQQEQDRKYRQSRKDAA